MDRKKIKAAARARVQGNVWKLFMPVLVIGAISIAITLIVTGIVMIATGNNEARMNPIMDVVNLVISLAFLPISVGLTKYYLNFLRGEKFSLGTLFENYKEYLAPALLAGVIACLVIILGSILLIVPGIIAMLGLNWFIYLIADGETKGLDSLTKSWEMMKGYKGDLFVFFLSFLGWFLLGIMTFGVLFVWLIPYISVSDAMYYEELRKKHLKNTAKKSTAK